MSKKREPCFQSVCSDYNLEVDEQRAGKMCVLSENLQDVVVELSILFIFYQLVHHSVTLVEPRCAGLLFSDSVKRTK